MDVSRVWYLVINGIPEGAGLVRGCIAPLVFGFIRDGAFIAGLLIPVQIMYFLKIIDLPSKRTLNILNSALAISFSIFLAILMADVEFFRYFGSHFNITHLGFITDLDALSSSFLYYTSPASMIIEFLIFPGLYLFVNLRFHFRRIDHFFLRFRSIFISILILIAGVSIRYIPLQNTLIANLTENYGVEFLKHIVLGDEIKGRQNTSIEKILDTLPLKKEDASKTPPWFYVDPEYPLIKATAYHLCRLGKLPKSICEKDNDGDGYVLGEDCNDLDADIHPGAYDIPRNGIDEDCSGCDADPPNIIYIHWEGIRAVNVGSIGYSVPSTPNFDKYARDGLLFTNAYANGTQTRWSLISVYCSILPRLSTKWIFKHNPKLNLLSFPEILQANGYETMYLHGGYINFGNLLNRFEKWFETRYDRTNPPIKDMEMFNWGLTDRDLFNLAYDIIKTRTAPRPFYITIATISMHHPFGLPEKGFEIRDHTDARNQLSNIARYSDNCLGDFLEKILGDEELENTIILISSDHGINWFYPHEEGDQGILWEDLVWVPIALIGKAWNVKPGVVDEVRQLADIGPTILDRLGIEVPNPFIGQSLLRRFKDREPKAFFATANGGFSAGLRIKNYKYFTHFQTSKSNLYDIAIDREEMDNLSNNEEYKEELEYYYDMVSNVYSQNNSLIEKNRIWNWDYWIDYNNAYKSPRPTPSPESLPDFKLLEAAKSGDIKNVKGLIASGADVNARDKAGWTPLHLAAENGYMKMASLLLANGANVNARCNLGTSPLHMAAWNGNVEIVRVLLNNGADVNAKHYEEGCTPLHLAVENGSVEVIKLLLENGAEADARDKDGLTPLDIAKETDNAEAINVLQGE